MSGMSPALPETRPYVDYEIEGREVRIGLTAAVNWDAKGALRSLFVNDDAKATSHEQYLFDEIGKVNYFYREDDNNLLTALPICRRLSSIEKALYSGKFKDFQHYAPFKTDVFLSPFSEVGFVENDKGFYLNKDYAGFYLTWHYISERYRQMFASHVTPTISANGLRENHPDLADLSARINTQLTPPVRRYIQFLADLQLTELDLYFVEMIRNGYLIENGRL